MPTGSIPKKKKAVVTTTGAPRDRRDATKDTAKKAPAESAKRAAQPARDVAPAANDSGDAASTTADDLAGALEAAIAARAASLRSALRGGAPLHLCDCHGDSGFTSEDWAALAAPAPAEPAARAAAVAPFAARLCTVFVSEPASGMAGEWSDEIAADLRDIDGEDGTDDDRAREAADFFWGHSAEFATEAEEAADSADVAEVVAHAAALLHAMLADRRWLASATTGAEGGAASTGTAEGDAKARTCAPEAVAAFGTALRGFFANRSDAALCLVADSRANVLRALAVLERACAEACAAAGAEAGRRCLREADDSDADTAAAATRGRGRQAEVASLRSEEPPAVPVKRSKHRAV